MPKFYPMDLRTRVMGCIAASLSLFYLPPYSPDFNPIENSFAEEKAMLWEGKIRDVDKLLLLLEQSPRRYGK
jgi:transposase